MENRSQPIIIAVLAIFIGLAIGLFSIIGVWNKLNEKFQCVKSQQSHYATALDVCSQKIQAVWEMSNQYMKHESRTLEKVTKARNDYFAKAQSFGRAFGQVNSEELTRLGNEASKASLAFRMQIEAYPQLMAAETTKENIQNLQESTEEIKTALDDWIHNIKLYNIYRGMFWPSLIGAAFSKFPSEIKYYESKQTKIDLNKIKPQTDIY